MRNPTRLERVDVRPRDVLPEADETAKEDADVPRPHRHELAADFDTPTALMHEPVDPGANTVRQRRLDRRGGDTLNRVRLRYRQRDHRRLIARLWPHRLQ